MRSWSELEKGFRSLRGSGLDLCVDHQTGTSGEHWRLKANSRQEAARFEALARVAGMKLINSSVAAETAIAQEQDPIRRWYQALRLKSSSYTVNAADVISTDSDGNVVERTEFATIEAACEASATLCVILESFQAVPPTEVDLLCTAPRYGGPCEHWRAAQAAMSADEPKYGRAAQEAVAAVEGLARIVVGRPRFTLGEALKEMRAREELHPALVKSLEGI